MTYATDRLLEEVTYVAYHLHWPMDEILDLEHPLRQRFVRGDLPAQRKSERRAVRHALALDEHACR